MGYSVWNPQKKFKTTSKVWEMKEWGQKELKNINNDGSVFSGKILFSNFHWSSFKENLLSNLSNLSKKWMRVGIWFVKSTASMQ